MYPVGSFLLNHSPEGTDLRLDVPPLRRLGSFLVQEHARRAPKSTQQHQDANREIDKVRSRVLWPSDSPDMFRKARLAPCPASDAALSGPLTYRICSTKLAPC